MRISYWSSDVCSSDLPLQRADAEVRPFLGEGLDAPCCHARVVVQVALDVGLAPAGLGDGLREDRREDQHRAQRAIRQAADGEHDFPASRSEERRVGKECAVRVDLGGRRIIKKKNNKNIIKSMNQQIEQIKQ